MVFENRSKDEYFLSIDKAVHQCAIRKNSFLLKQNKLRLKGHIYNPLYLLIFPFLHNFMAVKSVF